MPYGAWVGGKEGEGARCVGDHGWYDQGQQRERYQPATACERVEQAGYHRANKEQDVSLQAALILSAPHCHPDATSSSQRADDLT